MSKAKTDLNKEEKIKSTNGVFVKIRKVAPNIQKLSNKVVGKVTPKIQKLSNEVMRKVLPLHKKPARIRANTEPTTQLQSGQEPKVEGMEKVLLPSPKPVRVKANTESNIQLLTNQEPMMGGMEKVLPLNLKPARVKANTESNIQLLTNQKPKNERIEEVPSRCPKPVPDGANIALESQLLDEDYGEEEPTQVVEPVNRENNNIPKKNKGKAHELSQVRVNKVPVKTIYYITDCKNEGKGIVHVLDGSLMADTHQISVGKQPMGVAVNPGKTLAFVANYQSNSISVIDLQKHEVIKNIKKIRKNPYGIAFTPNGNAVVVSTTNIYVIEYSKDEEKHTYRFESHLVKDREEKLVEIDNKDREKGPGGVAANPNDNIAYVVDRGGKRVIYINTEISKNSIICPRIEKLDLNNPIGVAVNSNGNKIYITHSDNKQITIMSTAGNIIEQTSIGVHPHDGITVVKDNIFTTNRRDSTVTLAKRINQKNGWEDRVIPVAKDPIEIVYSPNDELIITHPNLEDDNTHTITVINATTNRIVEQIETANHAFGITAIASGSDSKNSNAKSSSSKGSTTRAKGNTTNNFKLFSFM